MQSQRKLTRPLSGVNGEVCKKKGVQERKPGLDRASIVRDVWLGVYQVSRYCSEALRRKKIVYSYWPSIRVVLLSYRQTIREFMPAPRSDLLPGTLDLLILKALTLQELHGMGVSRRIAQITGGAFDVKAGSLFPALHRMEQAGWLTSFWGESETNRREILFVDQSRQKAAAH